MRVLSIDPGAERLGWAVLQSKAADNVIITSVDFGLYRVPRGKAKYQEYRLQLIEFWVDKTEELLAYEPDVIVSETVPPVGGGAFASNGIQGQLATAAVTTLQAMALKQGFEVKQIAANTVKATIGGSKSATKQQVRNGVISILPELEQYRKNWVKVFEEPDAFAVGLSYLGQKKA